MKYKTIFCIAFLIITSYSGNAENESIKLEKNLKNPKLLNVPTPREPFQKEEARWKDMNDFLEDWEKYLKSNNEEVWKKFLEFNQKTKERGSDIASRESIIHQAQNTLKKWATVPSLQNQEAEKQIKENFGPLCSYFSDNDFERCLTGFIEKKKELCSILAPVHRSTGEDLLEKTFETKKAPKKKSWKFWKNK